MANEVIQLVRNDTEPQLELKLTESLTSGPMDLSNRRVFFHLRRNPREGVLLTREALIPGTTATDGVAYVDWGVDDLDLPRGVYEAEIEVTGTDDFRQTVFETLELEIRENFA